MIKVKLRLFKSTKTLRRGLKTLLYDQAQPGTLIFDFRLLRFAGGLGTLRPRNFGSPLCDLPNGGDLLLSRDHGFRLNWRVEFLRIIRN